MYLPPGIAVRAGVRAATTAAGPRGPGAGSQPGPAVAAPVCRLADQPSWRRPRPSGSSGSSPTRRAACARRPTSSATSRPSAAPEHFHTYDEVIYVLEGRGRDARRRASSDPVAPGRASSFRRAPCTAWRTPAPGRCGSSPCSGPPARPPPRFTGRNPGISSAIRTHSRGGERPMKVRLTLVAAALTALVAAGCGSSSSSSSSSSSAAASASSSGSGKSCKATIAIEGPFTGPVAQVGLEQLHFAQLAVADDNKANGTDVTLAQDDTQLTPSHRHPEDPGDHRHQRRGGRRARPAARRSRPSGRCSDAPGWRSSPARRRCRR